MGSEHISNALLEMFFDGSSIPATQVSPSSPIPMAVNPNVIAPLSFIEFITCILIPQVTIWLIQADLECSEIEVVHNWKRSHIFGMVHNSSNNDKGVLAEPGKTSVSSNIEWVKIEDDRIMLEKKTGGDIAYKAIYKSNVNGEEVKIILIDSE
jgi:hypothetical protein